MTEKHDKAPRKRACFRFYGPLNDFLPAEHRGTTIEYTFLLGGAIKDAVEALGVPHTEVALLIVNGEPCPWSRPLGDGDRVSVFPAFTSIEIRGTAETEAGDSLPPRFVADTHLGRLASYLRMLGFDTLYRNDASDEQLASCSRQEERILLTRDRGLLKRSAVVYGYYVRSTRPLEQLREVTERFALAGMASPFTRCTQCNALLEAVSTASALPRVPPGTRLHYTEFWQCPGCRRIYWQGPHYRHMQQLVNAVCAADPRSGAS